MPDEMQRAMARQAEAERERRAKIINAEGEFQAAAEARRRGRHHQPNPATLQLRYLQTLLEIGVNQNSTIVFPLPMDVISPSSIWRGAGGARRASPLRRPRRPLTRARATCRPRGPSALGGDGRSRLARDETEIEAASSCACGFRPRAGRRPRPTSTGSTPRRPT